MLAIVKKRYSNHDKIVFKRYQLCYYFYSIKRKTICFGKITPRRDESFCRVLTMARLMTVILIITVSAFNPSTC